MKRFDLIHCVLVLSLLAAVSCDEQQTSRRNDDLLYFKNTIVSSGKLESLDIDPDELDLDKIAFVNSEKLSLFIPFFADQSGKSGVIGFFGVNKNLKGLTTFKIVTSTRQDEFETAMRNNAFDASLTVTSEYGSVNVRYEKSKLKEISSSSRKLSTAECNGFTQSGGPLDCAGLRLENMNWFDKAICYTSFMVCMGQLVGSCIVDNCEVNA